MSDSPARILIIRSSAIGDIVMASPMLRTLKSAWPDAKIDWLVEPAYSCLLKGNPHVNRVIEWDKPAWKKMVSKFHLGDLCKEARSLARVLRLSRYDLVLDAQGLLRSRVLAWLSGGKDRIGFDSKEPGKFLMNRIISKGPDSHKMSSEYYFMMVKLGLEPGDFRPFIVLKAEDEAWAAEIIKKHGIKGPYFVICPFTTRPQKHWFLSYWTRLTAHLAHFYAVDVVVLGGPGDEATGEEIAKRAGKNIHNLAGRATLTQSAALLKGASLAIGVDTGLTHMATAFGVPVIALFGSTRPYLDAGVDSTKVLYSGLSCSPCKRKPTCNGKHDCMRWITPEMVLEEAQELILNINI